MKAEIEKILGDRIWEIEEIDTDKISFTDEVRAACKQNYCGKYNTCWVCPPAIGEIADLKPKYLCFKKAVIFTTKWDIEDCFDMEGMLEAGAKHSEYTDELTAKLKEAGKTFKTLGGGSCRLCKKCTYPDAPCRFPDKTNPSIEAIGIDVVRLAASCGMHYINGENTVTYFSAIFY